MKTALIAVDVQWDFTWGSMGDFNRLKVVKPILALAEKADLVIGSQDWHPPTHCSFVEQGGPFPAHCIQGTLGSRIEYRVKGCLDYVVRKGMQPDKDEFSAFAAQATLGLLCGHGIGKVIVAGLCTEFCIRATALDSLAAGFITEIPLRAIYGVSQQASEDALTDLALSGVRLT